MNLTLSQVTKKYNRAAALYNILEWPIEKIFYQRWRKDLLKSVRGNVLEIGVGTGKNLPFYNYTKCNLTAVDISKGMLNKAKKLAQKKNFPVKFKLTTTDLPFEDNTFDYIVCTFVLCSVPEQKEVLQQMKRVLKPQGTILFLEHVLSKNKFFAFIERLHNPITKWLLGVSINRDTIASIREIGLKITKEQNLALKDIFKRIEVTK